MGHRSTDRTFDSTEALRTIPLKCARRAEGGRPVPPNGILGPPKGAQFGKCVWLWTHHLVARGSDSYRRKAGNGFIRAIASLL